MTRFTLAVSACVLSTTIAYAAGDSAVVRLDPALDALVAPDAKVELVKGGFGFTEGPVWMQRAGAATSCSPTFPATWCGSSRRDGKASVYLENVGYTGAGGVALGRHPEQRLRPQRPEFEEFP